MRYSAKVMDHFLHPRNVGTIENADGIGEVGNPACGDIMRFYISVRDGRLEDVKFQTFGCGAAIAVSSMISEMARGKTLEEASRISNRDVADALDGLPRNKLHCSNLGADALQAAIRDYYARNGDTAKDRAERATAPDRSRQEPCKCPYCDIEIPKGAPFCKKCGAKI